LHIDITVVAHYPGDIVLLSGVVERLIGIDGHVGGPVVVAPIHSDDDQPGKDPSDILLNSGKEWCS